MDEHLEKDRQVRGMLVTGDFGAGKSHLLEYLQHLALDANFVCSRVVISKETPLWDPAKVFKAAIESAQVPGLSGHAVQEIAARLPRDRGLYAGLRRWCERNATANGALFAATLLLHERLGGDPETVEKIIWFWSGEPLGVGPIRRGLKQAGADFPHRVRGVPIRELALQRFAFIPQLFRAAGYRGWLLAARRGRAGGTLQPVAKGQVLRRVGALVGMASGGAILRAWSRWRRSQTTSTPRCWMKRATTNRCATNSKPRAARSILRSRRAPKPG